MKNLLKTSMMLSFFALIYSGCSSTKVVSDKDHTVDFSNIRTFEYYGWANNSDEIMTRFDKERIETAFANEARKRGITRVESNGDVIVSLFIVADVKTQKTANTTTTGMGMGGMGMGHRGMRHPGWGWGGGMQMQQSHTVINETNYIEGTLMIDIFDKSDKKLIWQAIGTKTVSEDPKKREKGIPKKVAAIMKEYPVKPIKK